MQFARRQLQSSQLGTLHLPFPASQNARRLSLRFVDLAQCEGFPAGNFRRLRGPRICDGSLLAMSIPLLAPLPRLQVLSAPDAAPGCPRLCFRGPIGFHLPIGRRKTLADEPVIGIDIPGTADSQNALVDVVSNGASACPDAVSPQLIRHVADRSGTGRPRARRCHRSGFVAATPLRQAYRRRRCE